MAKKKIINTKFLVIGGLLVLLVVIVGVAGLLLSGRMTVVWGQPTEQAMSTQTRVCGDDVVTTYNRAALYEPRGESDQYMLDEKGLKTLVTDIEKKPGYESDPTCQTILLATAIFNEDYEAAKKALAAVESLHDKHLYVDSNLRTGGTVSAYEVFVGELAPSNQGNEEAKGGS